MDTLYKAKLKVTCKSIRDSSCDRFTDDKLCELISKAYRDITAKSLREHIGLNHREVSVEVTVEGVCFDPSATSQPSLDTPPPSVSIERLPHD